MVGRALENNSNLKVFEVHGKTSEDLDFRNRDLVLKEFSEIKPNVLVIAAAKVGGIRANQDFPVEYSSEMWYSGLPFEEYAVAIGALWQSIFSLHE